MFLPFISLRRFSITGMLTIKEVNLFDAFLLQLKSIPHLNLSPIISKGKVCGQKRKSLLTVLMCVDLAGLESFLFFSFLF